MNAAHRRYVVLEQGVGAVSVNFLLNVAIAWAAFRGMSSIPIWGAQSIAGDTIATAFVLPFLTCLIVTPLAHRRAHICNRSGGQGENHMIERYKARPGRAR
jgi:hypothetical protein